MMAGKCSALVVALSGGIGSGKSLAMDLFRDLGAESADADVIARQVVRPGTPALRQIEEKFGSSVIRDGELDRQRMRAVVFGDATARRRLEGILHPLIRDALLAAVRGCTRAYCLLAIPLLTEFRADYDFIDRVLIVDVSPEVQKVRIMLRDRCTAAEAEKIISVQAGRRERLLQADDVIDNDGAPEALKPMIARLHALYGTRDSTAQRGKPAG